MGWHLTDIPHRASETGFYVAKLDEHGFLKCISDEDPKDDVRKWDSLGTAQIVAKGYPESWAPDIIVEVSQQGWIYRDIETGALAARPYADQEKPTVEEAEDFKMVSIPPTEPNKPNVFFYVGQKSADYDSAGTFALCEMGARDWITKYDTLHGATKAANRHVEKGRKVDYIVRLDHAGWQKLVYTPPKKEQPGWGEW